MSHARADSPPHCARACTQTAHAPQVVRGLAASASESGAKPTDARPRTNLVAALPAARARSIGDTQRRRWPRKGAQKRRNARAPRRLHTHTFTHPPRAVRPSRDLLPRPMNSAPRTHVRVRVGKIPSSFEISRPPGQQPQSPTRRHAWCVWRRDSRLAHHAVGVVVTERVHSSTAW